MLIGSFHKGLHVLFWKLSLLEWNFHLILIQNIIKIKKKRDCIFLKVDKMSKMAKSKMAASVYTNEHIYE